VIGSHHCDIPFVLCPELREFVAPERDSESLAKNLLRLMQSADQWPDLGRAARAWIEQGFTIQRTANSLAAIYQELIGN
jgi:colanic acid/amylovoran biosynthesis glycosyltransferase